MHFETLAIHDGHSPDKHTGAVSVPVYQTSVFEQDDVDRPREFMYSRVGNPTRAALEASIANLEGARHGLAFASGVAAEMAVLQLLHPGDEVLAMAEIYGGTLGIMESILKPNGVTVTYVPGGTPEAFHAAISDKTRLIWIESPGNPLLNIVDIAAIAELAQWKGVTLVVDNTFASPYLQNPLALGAHIVVHSTSKYLGGHSDVIGGAVAVSDPVLHEKIRSYQIVAGAIAAPWDSWLVLRGIKTLKVRMEEQCASAAKIADYLSSHPAVAKVYYPGLSTHPGHALAARQMRLFGAVVSVDLKGGLDAVRLAAKKTQLFVYSGSLGSVESQMGHPATMSHRHIGAAERARRGIGDGLLRLSIGLENADDLIADLGEALGS